MEETKEIHIKEDCKVILADNAMLSGSSFVNVNMSDVFISDANLSDLKIEGAQLGGAIFENIGMYPPDHPMYDPALEQRPLSFDNCDLHKSKLHNCNLSGVTIT